MSVTRRETKFLVCINIAFNFGYLDQELTTMSVILPLSKLCEDLYIQQFPSCLMEIKFGLFAIYLVSFFFQKGVLAILIA